MRRMAEIAAFLGLSAAVHAGVMAGLGGTTGGPEGQGDGGADRVSLQAAPESIAALADRWTTPPEVAHTPAALERPNVSRSPTDPSPETAVPRAPVLPLLPTQIPEAAPEAGETAPALARPALSPPPAVPVLPPSDTAPDTDMRADAAPAPRMPPRLTAPQAPAQPTLDTAAPPPPDSTRLAATTSPRPPQRPATSAPQPARMAAGAGGGATQGAATAPPRAAAAPNPAQEQSLMAQWGGQIMARIERARPRVRGSGQVMLALQVARSGQLAGVSVSRSSGDPALDAAALAAVSRAGRFPPAPEGLTNASYGFSLPIRFR